MSVASEKPTDRASFLSALKTLTSADEASPEVRAASATIQDMARRDVLVCVQLAHTRDNGKLGWLVLVDRWFRDEGAICESQFGPVLEFLALSGDEDLALKYLSASGMRKWPAAWRFAIQEGSSESIAMIGNYAATHGMVEFADAIGERTARARSIEFLFSLPFEPAREWSAVMAETLLKFVDAGAPVSEDVAAGLRLCQVRLNRRYSEEVLKGPGISEEERSALLRKIDVALGRATQVD
jgi:hypothetical protein